MKDKNPFISLALAGIQVNAEVGQETSFISGSLKYWSISVVSNHDSLYPTIIDTKYLDQFGEYAMEINFEINQASQ